MNAGIVSVPTFIAGFLSFQCTVLQLLQVKTLVLLSLQVQRPRLQLSAEHVLQQRVEVARDAARGR